MGKTNALMLRYKVEIDLKPISDIITITGFSLGEEGTLEVPEWDRDALIADGKRKIQPVGLKYRFMKGLETHKYFKEWWDERHSSNRNIVVIWTSRDRNNELFRWVFEDCEFNKMTAEDQELGTPKLGTIECGFLPYEVRMLKK